VRYVLDVDGTEIIAAARQHNAPEGSDQLWLTWQPGRTLVVPERPNAKRLP
jgi:hypothetical protein